MPEEPTLPSQYDPGSQQAMDRLFELTNRGPFSGYTPDQISQELKEFDQFPSGITEDSRFPLYLQGYIIGNVYNDRFIAGPPDGHGSVIDNVENKLPGWTLVADDNVYATWSKDSYDNGTINFYANDAVVDDETIYLTQDVYVPGGNVNIMSVAGSFESGAAHASIKPIVSYEYIYPSGLTTTEDESEFTNVGDEAIHRKWLMTRTKAYAFLRIKLGFRVKTSSTFTSDGWYLGSLYWTWVEDPESYDVTLRFRRGDQTSHWSPAASTTYALELVPTDLHINVSKWFTSGPGMFLAASLSTDATITAGSMELNPTVDGTASSFGVQLGYNLYGGTDDYLTNTAYGRDLDGVSSFDFFRGDLIGIEMNTDSSWALSAGGCWSGTLHLRLVHDTADGVTGGGLGPAGS